MRGRITAAASAALMLVSALAATEVRRAQNAEAASRYRVRTERVGRGLTLMRIRDSRGPNRIRVLRLTPASPLRVAVELANDVIPGHESTSSMAQRNGAIAAINGDYTLLPSDPRAGRPVHTFAQNAELITSPLFYGRNFAITPDEQSVYIGHPRFDAWLSQPETGEQWEIHAWNEAQNESGELSVYTPLGGYSHRPPPNACSARLVPLAAPALDETGVSITQPFTVTARACKSRPMARKKGTVVAAPWGSLEGTQIETGLVVGEQVALGWTTGWPGVDETVGGNPSLLENGVVTIGPCPVSSPFCRRNPRTGIGVDTSGRILLVTVDGRQESSVGMTLDEFAALFEYLDATSALNLDGGGSTTMWVRGRIVNRYSDPGERPVGSSVLVLPPHAPGPAPSPTPTPLASPTPTDMPGPGLERFYSASDAGSVCRVWRDPGSTGGLLDYVARRDQRYLSGTVREALEVFRGRRTCREVLGARP